MLSFKISSMIYIILLLSVHMLLGWDRPVDGRVASLQLLNMIEASEKASSSIGSIIPSKQPTTVPYSLSQSVFTPLSVSLTDAYHEIIPRVFSALASALQRETRREGTKDHLYLIEKSMKYLKCSWVQSLDIFFYFMIFLDTTITVY